MNPYVFCLTAFHEYSLKGFSDESLHINLRSKLCVQTFGSKKVEPLIETEIQPIRFLCSGFLQWHISYVTDFSSDIYHYVTDFSSDIYHYVTDFPSDIYRYVTDFSSDIYRSVTDFSSDIYRYVTDFCSDIYRYVTDFSNDIYRYVTDFSSDIYHYVIDFFSDIYRYVTDFSGKIALTCTKIAYSQAILQSQSEALKPPNQIWTRLSILKLQCNFYFSYLQQAIDY